MVAALSPRYERAPTSFHDAVVRIHDAGADRIVWSQRGDVWECYAIIDGVRLHGWGATGFDAAIDLAGSLEARQ